MGASPAEILKKYWNYPSFRDGQEAVIEDILKKNDVLALFPTGGGKSICFQVPGLMLNGLTLVVSPLVSLMKDQADALKKRDIHVAHLHSGLSQGEIRLLMENAMKGRYQFLYLSPERLATENFREYLPQLNVALLVVDEAHCISQWGYDFRPSYLHIHEVRELLPNVKIAAFTASAPPKVQQDIIAHLGLKNVQVHKTNFSRPNIHFYSVLTDNKSGYVAKALNKSSGSALVFCDTRRETEEMARFLDQFQLSVDFYHAGLSAEIRTKKQEKWLKDQTRIMVCTNAFGMGVDKPNVRLVIHQSPPASPEAYYQEAGRAGRDGENSWCILLYRQHEIEKNRKMILESFPETTELLRAYHAIYNYYAIADGAGAGLAYQFDLKAVSDRYRIPQLLLLNAVKNIEILGYWSLSDGVFAPSRIIFRWPYDTVYEFKLKNPDYEFLIDMLLRSYGGIFDNYTRISEFQLAKRLHKKESEIEADLLRLQSIGIVDYLPANDKPTILFVEPRNANPVFPIKFLEPLRNAKLNALQVMEEYLGGNVCRSVFWEMYFGDAASADCGVCDICKKKQSNKADLQSGMDLRNEIKKLIEQNQPDMQSFLESLPDAYADEMKLILRQLMDNKSITLDQNRKLNWNL